MGPSVQRRFDTAAGATGRCVEVSGEPLVELVRSIASDGVTLDGALTAPAATTGQQAALPVDAVLMLPGVGGSFYSSALLARTAELYAAAGVAALRVNTRGHDTLFTSYTPKGPRRLGAAAELVSESTLDVAAWLEWIGGRGWRRVLLWGHSLGAIKSVYTQATAPSSAVVGIVALSPPRLSATAFRLGEGSAAYLHSLTEAKRQLAAGKGDSLIESRFPFPMPMTAETFVDKYGGERYSIESLVEKLRCPSQFFYGERELAAGQIAFSGLDTSLPPRNPLVTCQVVPAADHSYRECVDQAFAMQRAGLERAAR